MQSILIVYFYFGAKGLQKELDNYAKTTNLLNIERDLEIFQALNENNITRLKNNIDVNFMFHLKPIETDNLESQISFKNSSRLCNIYNEISKRFKKNYQNKYPKSINELNSLCK